ncbi:MAG: PEP-CTERM sorting domain-containing protein [Bryobacter sp.]|nr:PEP-CTERM sorting domain-containing protein [Bryobacter sp.]
MGTVEPGFGDTSQWSDWVTFQTPPSTVSFSPTQYGAAYGNYNAFTWVAPSSSTQVLPGHIFRFGRLNFTNGSYYYMTEIDIRLQAVCTGTVNQCANFGPHEFTGTIRLISNSGDGTPSNEADQFFIVQRPDLGSVFVYDIDYQPLANPGSTGSIFLNGYIGSLVPTGFEAANGAAFLGSSIPEDPNQGGGTGEVPEPSTLLLALGGIALLAWRRK